MKSFLGALLVAVTLSFLGMPTANAADQVGQAAFQRDGDKDGDKDGHRRRRRHHKKHHHCRHHKHTDGTQQPKS